MAGKGHYGPVHRSYVQIMLTHKTMTERKAIRAFLAASRIEEEPASRAQFKQFIATINQSLKPLFMKIDSVIDETTGVKMWGLVNEVADESSKIATSLEPADIAYFRKLIELIVKTPSGSISTVEATNIGLKLERRVGQGKAEALCQQFVERQWLVKPAKGLLALGSRSLLELRSYIKDTYPDDVGNCFLCNTLAIQAQVCRKCGARYHIHCLQRIFYPPAALAGGEMPKRVCLNCKADWEHEVPRPTPEAPEEDADEVMAPGAALGGNGKAKKRTVLMSLDGEEDAAASGRATRRSRRSLNR